MRHAYLPWLLLLVALGVLAWTYMGRSAAVAEARSEAETWMEVADSAESEARADSLRADSLQTAADSMARTYSADSLSWVRQRRQDRAQIARLASRASRTADSLSARLDSVGQALFAQFRNETDSIIAGKDAQIASLEAERASLWEQRETMAELVESLEGENDGLRETNEALRRANEALRRGLNSTGRQNRLLKLAGIGLAGLAVYDRVAG